MTTLLLLRHGRSSANVKGVLSGRRPGVHLDSVGREQAASAGDRLRDVRLDLLVSSPLERCVETIEAVAAGRRRKVQLDDGLIEADYGTWSGKKLSDLAKDPLWSVVQSHPSAVTFPGRSGEAMTGMAARAVGAVRRLNAKVGATGTWLACSHGDVIKAIVADALGLHLDQFQRIVIDPASITVIRYTKHRPFVVVTNSTSGSLAPYLTTEQSSDAAVGGGAGHAGG
ncbi:MSMEG_4193 family putative phosphomutase [Cumulibacter manganitolerans]|uniref:MSMEG_4193 family putative phosphomutase n=1 Tax=Cumulibacter manganitolerans TaxID=1884992 RepID=UPI00129705A9|nr:MSMEG_4193 family putative phosphomutase [Cumulibacter manganitolerans]